MQQIKQLDPTPRSPHLILAATFWGLHPIWFLLSILQLGIGSEEAGDLHMKLGLCKPLIHLLARGGSSLIRTRSERIYNLWQDLAGRVCGGRGLSTLKCGCCL